MYLTNAIDLGQKRSRNVDMQGNEIIVQMMNVPVIHNEKYMQIRFAFFYACRSYIAYKITISAFSHNGTCNPAYGA